MTGARVILDDMDFKLESLRLQCNGLLTQVPQTQRMNNLVWGMKQAIMLAERHRDTLERELSEGDSETMLDNTTDV